MNKQGFLLLVIALIILAGAIIWFAERTKKQAKVIGGDLGALNKTLTDPNASATVSNVRGIADDAVQLSGMLGGIFGNKNSSNYDPAVIQMDK